MVLYRTTQLEARKQHPIALLIPSQSIKSPSSSPQRAQPAELISEPSRSLSLPATTHQHPLLDKLSRARAHGSDHTDHPDQPKKGYGAPPAKTHHAVPSCTAASALVPAGPFSSLYTAQLAQAASSCTQQGRNKAKPSSCDHLVPGFLYVIHAPSSLHQQPTTQRGARPKAKIPNPKMPGTSSTHQIIALWLWPVVQ
jgi:hypothetical protein